VPRQAAKDQNNKYSVLTPTWVFIEAANFARRYDEQCRRWYDRKAAKTSNIIATKALGCKLAKAAWHLMSQCADYDPSRMFPGLAAQQSKDLESRRQPAMGLDPEPCGLIGGGGSRQRSKRTMKTS
jgi:hypothetical protein